MLKNNNPNAAESAIFEEMSILKVIRTPQDRLNIIHNDLSVSVIIPFEGINNTSFSDYDFDMIFLKIQSMLDQIQDTNLTVQLVMTRTNDLKSISSSHLPTYLRPRADYIQKLAENYQLFTNHFYLSLFYANTSKEKDKSFVDAISEKLFGKSNYGDKYYEDRANDLPTRIGNLSVFTEKFMNLLYAEPINLRMKLLQTEQEYWDVLRKFTAPKQSRRKNIEINQDSESPKVALFSGVRAEVKKDSFVLDDYYHKIFMLDRAPRQILYGKTIDVIESVPFEMIYSVAFRMMSYKESSDNFKLRYFTEAVKAGSNNEAIIRDKNLDRQLAKIDENWEAFVNGEGRGVSLNASLVLRADNEFIIKSAEDSGKTYEEYVRGLEQMLQDNVFADFGGGEWTGEMNTQWIVFNQLIPGCANLRDREYKLKEMMLSSNNVPYFFAMYDNQRPHIDHIGTNHFIDSRGNLFKFELKDRELLAHNYIISGSTGSGKSVLINTLLTMQFSERGNPPVICILDVGGDRGSYKKLMTLAKGEEINLSKPVKPTIQMFDLIPEKSRPTPDKIKQICQLFEDHYSKENDEKLYDAVSAYYTEYLSEGGNNFTPRKLEELFEKTFEMASDERLRNALILKQGECEPDEIKMTLIKTVLDIILSSNKKEVNGFLHFDEDMVTQALYEVYRYIGAKEKRYPKMSDLYSYLEIKFQDRANVRNDGKMVLQDIDQKLLSRLINWTRTGQYPMFDKETDLNTEANVILADLKGLASNLQLQQIYTLLLSELFTNKMYFIKDRRKVMVRDEAWSLMLNDKARQYFIEDMRTARKNGFVTITASQSALDYFSPDPAAGRAILGNSQVQIFCKIEGERNAMEIANEFGIPDDMRKELTNLGVKKVFSPSGGFVSAYSSFLMVASYNNKKNYFILKNLLHPFEYNLYSSSPEDNALVDFYLQHQAERKFNNLEDVLWHITKGNHIGDKELYEYLFAIGEKDMAKRVLGKG